MISVVVPVFNSINTLERCVASLKGQTYTDLEIILVEDSSTDGSDLLCDRMAVSDPGIKVIHKENKGVSSARNAGIDAASGEYIFFTDSDDYVEPDMAEKLLKALDGNDMAVCGFHHHYHGRDVVKIPDAVCGRVDDVFIELYGSGFLNMPWNKLFRREKIGRFPEDLSLGEDLLFNLDYLGRSDRISVVGEALCHYIQDDTGKSLSSQKRDDRFVLAKRIWHAVSNFYSSLPGAKDGEGIINARFVQDVLDDVEALPFDKTKTGKEKIAAIKAYCMDEDFKTAASRAYVAALDYKLVLSGMRRGWAWYTYLLCIFRSFLVRMGAHNG